MQLTNEQAEACLSLDNSLQSRKELGNVDVAADLSFDDENSRGNEIDDHYGDDDDDDDEMMASTSNDLVPRYTEFVLAESPLQKCILKLLITLYTHLPNAADDKFYSPLIRFLVLSSLRKSGEWLLPRRITQICAALLFCGRQVMMTLMQDEIMRDRAKRYTE